jgi:hypothetical protein
LRSATQRTFEKTNVIHRAQQVLAAGIAAAFISLTVMGFMAAKNAVPSEQGKHMPDRKQKQNPPSTNAPPLKPRSATTPTPENDIAILNGSAQSKAFLEAKKKVIDRLRDPEFVAEQMSAVNRL